MSDARLKRLEGQVRRLERKLRRSDVNRERLEDQKERSTQYLRSVIDRMERTEADLKDKNAALEEAGIQLEASRSRAMAASAAKSRFLANMSHELRTPLNAIIGYSELLLEDEEVQPLADRELHAVLGSGRHLLGLINNILDISKIEAGRMEFDHRWFDLGRLLAELVETLQPLADQKSLGLGLSGSWPDRMMGDEVRLRQILMNLMSNAVKFSHDGEISLDIVTRDQAIVFSIRDTGIGMTPAQLDRVFLPFTQADLSTTRRFGGTGLGLTICKHLVELWGGTIDVTSTLGEGTVFEVVLPRIEDAMGVD